jgi:hypothetical protein
VTIYPGWIAGQRLTAADLAAGQFIIAVKTTNTDRALTSTPNDDPDLQFDVAANAVYAIEFYLHYAATSTPAFKTIWNVPVGASGNKGVQGPGSSATASDANNISMRSGVHGYTTNIVYGTQNSGTAPCFAYEESLLTTSSAGTVALQWSQNTSNATATRLAAGSWARCLRIS